VRFANVRRWLLEHWSQVRIEEDLLSQECNWSDWLNLLVRPFLAQSHPDSQWACRQRGRKSNSTSDDGRVNFGSIWGSIWGPIRAWPRDCACTRHNHFDQLESELPAPDTSRVSETPFLLLPLAAFAFAWASSINCTAGFGSGKARKSSCRAIQWRGQAGVAEGVPT